MKKDLNIAILFSLCLHGFLLFLADNSMVNHHKEVNNKELIYLLKIQSNHDVKKANIIKNKINNKNIENKKVIHKEINKEQIIHEVVKPFDINPEEMFSDYNFSLKKGKLVFYISEGKIQMIRLIPSEEIDTELKSKIEDFFTEKFKAIEFNDKRENSIAEFEFEVDVEKVPLFEE